MCGLFGMAGPEINKLDLSILDELMLVSSTRGTDGTGIYTGKSRSSSVHGFKIVGDPFYWRYSVPNKIEDKIYSILNTWFIGHTRWRSVGNIEVGAAQPFRFDNVIGSHNGTIKSISWEEGFKSDSHAFVTVLNEYHKEPIKIIEALRHDDSYALVWFDVKDGTINFARNKYRTLFYAVNKKRKVAYWASEYRMLEFALNKEDVTIFAVEPFYHYKVKPDEIRYVGEDKTPFSKTPIKEPEKPVVVQQQNSNVVYIGNSSQRNESHPAQGSFFTYDEETGEFSDIPFDVDLPITSLS